MNKLKNFVISDESNLLVASKAILANHNRCVFLERDKRIIGVFSEGDLLKALLFGSNLQAQIKPFINLNFLYLTEKNLIEAKSLFLNNGISVIPVLEKKTMKLKDIITIYDVLKIY